VGPSRAGPRWGPGLAIGLALGVALLHVLLISHRYFVGSFDDDANYILTGRALLDGQALTGHLTNGESVVGGYPPGYPALLVPLLWLFPHRFLPLRLLSTLCFAALFPLAWYYFGRLHLSGPVRVAVLGLMALNPVLATYATMVMAEMPFLCCLLILLIAVDRWDATATVFSPTGVAVILLAAELVWLKEAGIGMTIGLVVWLLLRRQPAKAVAVAGGAVLLLVPVVVARLVAHVPVAGDRYSQQLGSTYTGGLLGRLIHVVPDGVRTYVGTALPRSVVEFGSPFPDTGTLYWAIRVVWIQIPIFIILGVIVTIRRHRDASVLIVGVYLAETLLYPYVNERRVILALPVVLAWYAIGVAAAAGWVLDEARRHQLSPGPPAATMATLGVIVVVVPLVAAFPRDYLFSVGQDTSRPQGSRYMTGLRLLGEPAQVVETDYKYTTALFSGHRTADVAFIDEIAAGQCRLGVARAALATDKAGFLLIGALNKFQLIDNTCLYSLATAQPWAVRTLRTTRDRASVFELIGPGTAHPDLVDQLVGATVSGSGGVRAVPLPPVGRGDHPGVAYTTPTQDGRATLTWSFPGARPLSQVSVGEAGAAGTQRGVALQVEAPDGRWASVASSPTAVGDRSGDGALLLATLVPGTRARAIRVVVYGSGTATALDVSALGETTRVHS
jgi:hypothetical protein